MKTSIFRLGRQWFVVLWGVLFVAAGETPAQSVDWNEVTGAPSAFGSWVASAGVFVDTRESVQGGTSLRLEATDTDNIPPEGNNLTFRVQGPGQLSFKWKSWLEGGITGSLEFVNFSTGFHSVGVASISTRQDWQEVTALIPPGQHLMRWSIHEGGLARSNAVWVDDVKLTPVDAVSLDDAAETSGLSLQASGWHGLRHHTAADGSDAIFAGNADGNFLKASMTGPGWLSFNRRPAPESPQWVREQHFIQPGPRQLQWVFPLSSITEAWAMGMDAMKFSPLQTVPLAEAADNAGPWAGSALGIVDPSPGVIGGSVVMLGKASLNVTGPGIVRFSTNGVIRVEIGGTGDYFGDSNRWEEFSQTVPAGPQTITWGTSEALSPGEYLDNVRFEPDHMVPLAEAMDTNLPVQATGGLGLANTSLAHDGVDCAVLRGPGEIRIPVVGPGRLTAWIYSCDVYLDDLELFGANSGWRFMSVDVDNGPHTVRFPSTYSWLVDRRIDEVSFFPGAAARYADALGSAPNVLWTYLGRSPPAVQTEGGESVLVSGSPASARMVLYSKAAVPWTAKWDLFASAGVIGGFYPEPYALLDEGAYILEHGRWVTKSMYMVARNEAGTSWIDAIIETDRSDGFWKIKAPRGELPSQPGAVSLAEALDSELAWTSTGTGWTAYGAAPWFGGGDAVLGVPTGSALMTEVTGPTFTRLNFKGGFTVVMDGTTQPSALPRVNVPAGFVPEGSHVLEITPNGSVVMDAFTLEPPAWQKREEIECAGISVAQPAGLPPIEVLDGDLARDGVDALKLANDSMLIARAESPGFMTWWGRLNETTPWQRHIVETVPGSMVIRLPATAIDELRLIPKVPVPLADALDLGTSTFTATPPGGWSGFAGESFGIFDHDAASLAVTSTTPAALSVSLPQAGVLSWRWRLDSGGALSHPADSNLGSLPGTGSRQNSPWHFGYLNVTAAGTATWNATGAPGSVWLDALAWRAGPPRPANEGVDAPDLAFTHNSGAWITVPLNGAVDGDAAFSNSSTAAIQTSVTGPALVTCAVMASSSGGLALSVNGTALSTTGLEANQRWVRQTVYVGAGTHTVAWTPVGSVGGDRFFLDDLRVEPATPPTSAEFAAALDLPAATFASLGSVLVGGPPESHDGTDAAILHANGSAATLTSTVQRGRRLQFWWAAPGGTFSENDGGRFSIDGVEVARIRPGTGWTAFAIDLTGTGPARVEWEVAWNTSLTTLWLDELTLTPLPAPAVTAAVAAGWTDAGWLGNPAQGGGGWTATSAISVDGLAALSAAPAQLELAVTGPGWLHFDYAAAGIDVLVDDRLVFALKRPGAVTEAAPNAWLRRGFRTDAVEIAEGNHRVRISADGYAVVDRLRLLPDLEQGILAWTTSPEAWTSTLTPQTLQVATTAGVAELSARVSGPGFLTFDWNTRSRVSEPYVDFLLDGVRLHQLLSTASSPWSMQTDLPPGMHTCTFRIPLVRPFQIQNVKVTPGTPPLAASAASDPLFRWSNAGSHWVLEPDLLRAPVDGGSGNDELVALVPGFSFVSWPSDALAGRAKLRNGFPVRQPLSLGDRKGFLLDRADTWTMSWTSGSGGSDSFVRDVQFSPLVEVAVEEALEVPAGWTFSLPDDRKWHALKGIPGAFDSWVDGDALVTSVRDNESPSTVRAVIQGPTRSVFTWGAPEGLAEFGAGAFTRAGVGLLQYGNKIILARDPVTQPEHCILDFPAGLHECGWTGWPCYSLAVDNLGPAAGPGIAEVLEAPDLPWAVASASRDLTGQVEIVGGNDVLRVESSVAAGIYGQVATQVVGPALLHCRVRVVGVVDVILGSERTSIGSTDWRDMTFAIEETGLTHVAFAPSEDATLWLDAVRIEAAGPAPVAAGPAEAAGAANLAWEWVDGWKAVNNPVVALDENGYAEGTFTIAAQPAAATLRVQGPGILSYRAYSTGDLRVRDGASELLGTVLPVFYWTSFRHLLGDGSHTVTFAANGLLRLDAVTWTPALAAITKTNALSDADGDGVPLILEHAFGLSDSMPDASVVHEGVSSGLPGVGLAGTFGDARLRVRYLQRHSGVRYIPEFADSLHGEWQAAPESSIRLIDSLNGLWSRYEATDPAPPGRTNRFARVRVEIAP